MSDDSDIATTFHRGLLTQPNCEGCPLQGSKIIPPEGNPHAKLALVGDAPGFYDVQNGASFQGPPGVFLDKLLSRAGVERNQVWLTNVVLCKPKTVQEGDKPLNPDQVIRRAMVHCNSRLISELRMVNPKVVLGLGAHAVRGILDPSLSMKGRRGAIHPIDLTVKLVGEENT